MVRIRNNDVYYKVVSSNNDGKLYSAMINTNLIKYGYKDLEQLNVEYKVGKFVKPIIKGTMLCVFKRFESANNFSYGISGVKIYSCHIKGKRISLPFNMQFQNIDNSLIVNVIKLWNEWLTETYPCTDISVCCEQVKLIQKIYPSE